MQPLEKKSTTQTYVLKGSINGDFDDFIKIRYEDQIDSVDVINNSFQFEGKVSSPKAFQFIFDSITSSEVFYLENDTLVFDIISDKVELDKEVFKDYGVRQLNGGKTQELQSYVNSLLKSTPKSKKNRTMLLNTMDSLIKIHPNHDYLGKLLSDLSMNQDLLYTDVRSLVSKMNVDELNPEDVAVLEQYQQKRRNYQIGSEIPSFELISLTSDPVLLKSEFSKLNLIVFWNSWCEDCISKQEQLLEAYRTYKAEGFEIIGVSVDTNQQDWIKAESQESFPWKSLRVKKGFTGEMASEMGILDLPQNYLVDKKGRIIEINLSLDELKTILSALLD
ncbi:redoxin domain-containing protein [Psychroflexus sp. YR1-1]|uniref:Redoxin domain-containing protein n=1 Tax=Psychroflexus aurantiacus TaxID=2709310 RepID=A0A6B3R2Q9_9FLAO|nr:thioredoxin-like domain-containing protein [Psychroflexus aurantiacus]NEV94318.1 redoxin domain-containing protein [Psychroflexus aurantiacus]